MKVIQAEVDAEKKLAKDFQNIWQDTLTAGTTQGRTALGTISESRNASKALFGGRLQHLKVTGVLTCMVGGWGRAK